jgi:hypothetical protein
MSKNLHGDHEDIRVINHLLDLSDDENFTGDKGETIDTTSLNKQNHIKPWVTLRPQTALIKSSEVHSKKINDILKDHPENVRKSLDSPSSKRIAAKQDSEKKERVQSGRYVYISNTISSRLSSSNGRGLSERIRKERLTSGVDRKLYSAKDEYYMQDSNNSNNSILHKIIGAGNNEKRYEQFVQNHRLPFSYKGPGMPDSGSR